MKASGVLLVLVCLLGGCRSAPEPANAAAPSFLRGAIVPMVTCYTEGDPSRVDLAATAQLSEWLCTSRASALFPVSGMGQWRLLSLAEKKAIIETVLEAARGRKPVLPGVGSPTTVEETLELAAFAESAGAAGLFVVTPDWLRDPSGRGIPDQDALVAYCATVCAAVKIPVILYDPKHEVLPATMVRLGELRNLRAMKYRADSAKAMLRMTRAAAGKVAILAGIEHTTLTTLAAGGSGVVGGGANLFPDLLAAVVEAFRAGDLEEARRLQWTVIEANERLKRLGGKLGIKRMLREWVGLDKIAVNDRGPPKKTAVVDPAEWREQEEWFERECGVRRTRRP